LYFEGVQLGQNIAALMGSSAALFLEGVPFGPNTVTLVGAMLFCIWKGCSLDQTLWL
jgi:hypothetical protein